MCASLALASLALIAFGPSLGSAGAVTFKKGRYTAKTSQEAVAGTARTITFRVRGRSIFLTKEPVVRRGFCLSTPVFLLEQDEIRGKINRRGRFSFTRTFLGSRINRISGRIIDDQRIEGRVVYHFDHSPIGLCTAGARRPSFIGTRRGGK